MTQNRRGEGYRLRDALLDAADRLIEESGSDRTLSLRAVARAAGVSAQAVYAHFAGLDDLIRGVEERRFAEIGRLLQRAEGQPHGKAFLRLASLGYCRWGLEHPRIYRSLFGDVRTGSTERPSGPLPGGDVFASLEGEMAYVLAEQGIEAEPTVARRATVQLWLSLHGIVSLRVALPFFDWPDVTVLVDDALAGALAGAARRGSR